jgi:cytoskeletal protein CcmA (bactofilin family)
MSARNLAYGVRIPRPDGTLSDGWYAGLPVVRGTPQLPFQPGPYFEGAVTVWDEAGYLRSSLDLSLDSLKVAGNLDVGGNGTFGGCVIATCLEIDGPSTFNGPVNINGNEFVSGTIGSGGTIHAGTDLVANGNVIAGLCLIGNCLEVNGPSTLNGDLHVTGNATIDGTLTAAIDIVLNDLTVDGNLQTNGQIHADGDIITDACFIGNCLEINGNADITGNLNVGGTINAGALNVTNLNVPGTLTGNVINYNTGTVAGNLYVNGCVITPCLEVNGNADITGTLTANVINANQGNFGDLNASNATIGDLTVTGSLTAPGGGPIQNPVFPPGEGGDTIVSIQIFWLATVAQIPPDMTQIVPSPYHEPYGRLGFWALLIKTAQGRQFISPLTPSDFPTVPYDASSFTAPQFPPNRYLYYPADPSVAGSHQYYVEIFPDSSWRVWTDDGYGISWSVESAGGAGVPNNDPNRPWGTGNPPYPAWPGYLAGALGPGEGF